MERASTEEKVDESAGARAFSTRVGSSLLCACGSHPLFPTHAQKMRVRSGETTDG